MRDTLNNWINQKSNWPILTTSIAKKWLHDGDGLQDRGITRDLDWGVPVKKAPINGMVWKVKFSMYGLMLLLNILQPQLNGQH